jgi:hypothetical protein
VQFALVVVGGAGALLVLAGSVVGRRWGRLPGRTLSLSGALVAWLPVGLALVFPAGLLERAVLVGVSFAPLALSLGLYPLYTRRARTVAGVGIAALLGGVVLRGWAGGIGRSHLLAAVALTIVAWDAADRAVGLGADVGRGASTVDVALTRTGGSLAVGACATLIATGLYGLTPATVPVASLALLLATLLVGLLALYLGDTG